MLNLTTPASQRTNTSDASFQSFRNVSACNRCRLRKHRCDQRLPRCEPCEKAGARCVGYDPLTKREVPRSYVCFLESQVKYLRQMLIDHGIEFKLPMHFDDKITTSRVDPTRHDGQRRHDQAPGRSRIEARVEHHKEHASLKRKLPAEASLPPQQLKRVLQLNLILKDLLTESYASRTCDREHVQSFPQTPISTQSTRNISTPYDLGPMPELSDDHTSSESSSGSPESLQHFDDSTSSHDLPVIYDGLDSKRSYTPETHCTPDITSMDLHLHTLETRAAVTDVSSPTVSVNHPASSELSGVQIRFDLGYDVPSKLAPIETEQPNYDLLDEFLVGWDEDLPE